MRRERNGVGEDGEKGEEKEGKRGREREGGGGRRKYLAVLVSLFIRTSILSDQGPNLMTSFNLNCFLKGRISKYIHTGGLGLECLDLGRGKANI